MGLLIKYENIDTDEEEIQISELKLQDYAIGFKGKLVDVDNNMDTDSYDIKKNHSLLLSGTRKTKRVSRIDSNTNVFSTSDIRKNVTLKHPSGDKVTLEHYSYKANRQDGVQASYTMKWKVKNTKANIELLGSKYITNLIGIKYDYGKDFIFPVGSYELYYNYNYNIRTDIAVVKVNLVSHNISADIVKTKTGTTITYNRSGNITVIKK